MKKMRENSKNSKTDKIMSQLKKVSMSQEVQKFHYTKDDYVEAILVTSQRDSDLPIDFQIGGENNEELSDNDIMFFKLLCSTPELHSPHDNKIRCSNSSISRIIEGRFTPLFIGKSLGKLHREGLIQLQFKRNPKKRVFWREISIIREALTCDIIQDLKSHNSEKVLDPSELEDLPMDLQVDLDSIQPLTNEDYYVLALIHSIEGQRKDNAIMYPNPSLIQLSKPYFSDTVIYKSLRKLVRKGLVQMDMNRALQLPQLWRKLLEIPGFESHMGFANWTNEIRKTNSSVGILKIPRTLHLNTNHKQNILS